MPENSHFWLDWVWTVYSYVDIIYNIWQFLNLWTWILNGSIFLTKKINGRDLKKIEKTSHVVLVFTSAWSILSSRRHEMRKSKKERKNFRRNFRNLTWSYLNELTWAEWLIWYDLLIWPDQLIRSGWFADQLIRLISSWSVQLIKKF